MSISPETYPIFRAVVYLIGIPVILYLCYSIMQRLRAIKELDAKLREEAAQNAANPYAQMASLYEQQEARELLKKAKRGKVK
ncbi:MAG: hypothetical protein OHK0029_11110 [Armatimonadaceae bacterium]